jgi:hypothetical protein
MLASDRLMPESSRDPARMPNEDLIRQLEDAGFELWYCARRGPRVVAGHTLDDLVRRAIGPRRKDLKISGT